MKQEPIGRGCAVLKLRAYNAIGRVSLARENEAGGVWGQEVHILHVNI